MSGSKREAMRLLSRYTGVPAERKVYTFGFKSIYLFSKGIYLSLQTYIPLGEPVPCR